LLRKAGLIPIRRDKPRFDRHYKIKADEATLKSADGVRETGRVLGINKNTISARATGKHLSSLSFNLMQTFVIVWFLTLGFDARGCCRMAIDPLLFNPDPAKGLQT
jgi:hypothetical protein